jgi:hypothetical protein
VAGIATAFALNPLLGVGAVALAATVLSAGVALSNKYSTNLPGGLEESMSGANNRIREQKLNNGSSISPIVSEVLDQGQAVERQLKAEAQAAAQ